jgi:haloacid dehalogenase-like hydrolase
MSDDDTMWWGLGAAVVLVAVSFFTWRGANNVTQSTTVKGEQVADRAAALAARHESYAAARERPSAAPLLFGVAIPSAPEQDNADSLKPQGEPRMNLSALFYARFTAVALLLASAAAQAQAPVSADPLPSWNKGAAKKAILDFVQATTDKASRNFVAPEARIATFDQDGTLWVEQPVYTQLMLYCIDQVPAAVARHPELKYVDPFRTVLSGNREAIAKLSKKDLEAIAVATLTGMTVEQFSADVKQWLATAKNARWKRPYTELAYQPMLEVLRYLRANIYKTYIATGGGQDLATSRPPNSKTQLIAARAPQSDWLD